MSPTDRSEDRAIDLDTALSRMEGSHEMLRELAGIFLREIPRWIREAKEALAGNEPESLARAAHDIKGSSDVFAAASAARLARELERMGREGELDEAEGVLGELERELARVLDALEAYLNETSRAEPG